MDKSVEITSRSEVFRRYPFRIEEVRLRFNRFDGTMSDEITRLNLDRGDSVGALVHDTDSDTVLLAEQFRFSTYDKGPGWILELPAGMVEEGEEPQRTVLREVEEEIGYKAETTRHIGTVYLSPGGTSERMHIFYIAVSAKHKTSAGGGLASENEDIRLVRLVSSEAIEKVAKAEIVDAKTVIALQWMQLNFPSR